MTWPGHTISVALLWVHSHLDLLNTAKITGFLRVVAQGSSRSSHAGVFRNNVQLGRKSGFHCTHCGGGRPCRVMTCIDGGKRTNQDRILYYKIKENEYKITKSTIGTFRALVHLIIMENPFLTPSFSLRI